MILLQKSATVIVTNIQTHYIFIYIYTKNSQINYSVLGGPSCTLPPFLCLSVLLMAVTYAEVGVKLFH